MTPDLLSSALPLAALAAAAAAIVTLLVAYPRSVRTARRRAAQAAAEAPPAPVRVLAEPAARAPAAPPEAVPVRAPAPAAAPAPRADLSSGLRKSRVALVGRLEGLLRGRPELDPGTLEEIEALLFGADLGVRTADELLEAARAAGTPERVHAALEDRALEILRDLPSAPDRDGSPRVLLMVGVNGSGKTTTIGKLASRWVSEGRKVLLAAADTYRAAAIDQLEIWAGRTGAGIVKGVPGGDPASVAFDAVKRAVVDGVDVVIVDTAGRLQTDQNLMDQLTKISRVVGREVPDAPHETLLVLDANTGQNAIRQAQEFARSVDLTGIVLSKLDGTAKGGVVLGIAQEVGVPVRYVGTGEGAGDLYDFEPETFVRALFERGPEG